jgi:hypothetical protein
MLKTYTYKSVSFHSKFKYAIIEIVKIKIDMKIWSIKIKNKKKSLQTSCSIEYLLFIVERRSTVYRI